MSMINQLKSEGEVLRYVKSSWEIGDNFEKHQLVGNLAWPSHKSSHFRHQANWLPKWLLLPQFGRQIWSGSWTREGEREWGVGGGERERKREILHIYTNSNHSNSCVSRTAMIFHEQTTFQSWPPKPPPTGHPPSYKVVLFHTWTPIHLQGFHSQLDGILLSPLGWLPCLTSYSA